MANGGEFNRPTHRDSGASSSKHERALSCGRVSRFVEQQKMVDCAVGAYCIMC